MPLDLTVVILTKNESIHIARALENIRGLAEDVVVVDSFSTDDTVEIAKAHGAVVLQNKFINHAKQFQWALDNAEIRGKWVMRLDADELIEPELRTELERRIPTLPDDVVGINLKRKHIFMDRWVRHGGRYPLVMLRIWRKGNGRIEDRWMDEHMVVWGGRTITMKGSFADHNLHDLNYFTTKHNGYATREAIEVLIQMRRLGPRDNALNAKSASAQAAVKRALKESVYNRLPFTVSASLYFLWRYVVQLGFLDGRSGLVYHFLQGYWYRFLVGAKLMELQNGIRGLNDPEEIKAKILDLTGHDLNATS
ncbi:glycosyltransferase family 2 protein [uncultured Sphaerotilus sp.]|uniref:glycosyltransferase family 2 protein n=1 Tax=uncultured Sphaerotilus sp. TaxID=474984 RepID=UPI0030CA3004